MDLPELIAALSEPSVYPDPVDRVEVRQTHMSAVFLAGARAYKLKKPVRFEFADLGTVEQRYALCREEVRLNQRLAPGIYEAVVPVFREKGGVRVGNSEEAYSPEALDWLVRMRRLPDQARLSERLREDAVGPEVLEGLACLLAAFHNGAPSGPEVSSDAGPVQVGERVRANLEAAKPLAGLTIHPRVLDRLRSLFEIQLQRCGDLVARRAEVGRPREGHGDLRLEHIYQNPGRGSGSDLVIIDCIEFDRGLRRLDPVCDMAFVVMDLIAAGRRDLASVFTDAYLTAAADPEGRALLPLYVAYRAAVRGKVEGLAALERELSEQERADALRQARRHWLVALEMLELPVNRPMLLLVGGLPGSGKSTLARELSHTAGFALLRSDVVRKELAGQPIGKGIKRGADSRLYTAKRTQATYQAMRDRAEGFLFEGRSTLIDASFSKASHRQLFHDLAVEMGVPCLFLECRIDETTARERLEARRDDASDADFQIRREMAARWEPVTGRQLSWHRLLVTSDPVGTLVRRVFDILRAERGFPSVALS